MQAIKPQVDVAQAKMKQASTREEQMAAKSRTTKRFIKKNNVSMVGGIGCLPLLIQMPIFISVLCCSLYKGIATASFLGMNLGQPKYDFSGISWFSLFSSRLYFNDWYS